MENINLSNGSNAKILFPLLLLSLVLVFSFAVNDVSAANATSTDTMCQANTVSSSITGKTTDLQPTVQSTSETTKKAGNTNKTTTNLNSHGIGTVNPSNLNYAMGINLTTSDISPNVGQQYYYTVIVTNNGPDNATGVQVKSGIPNSIKFNSFSTSQGTYNNPTGKWNIGYLASGASAVLQLFVTPTNKVAGTVVTKNATLVNTNETVNTTVSIPGSPASDVTLTLTASNLAPKVGQQFSYTLIATNNGPDLGAPLQVTSWIPAGLTINRVTVTEGFFSTLPPIWKVLTLASGASAIAQVFVTPKASLAGTTLTYKASNIVHTVTATIVVPKNIASNISLTKIASNLEPKVGQKFNYIVIATNNGPDTATGVKVLDKLPAGLIFNSYTATHGTYNSVTGIWNVGALVKGASAGLQLFVTPRSSLIGTTVTNTATSIGQMVTTTIVVPKNMVNNLTLAIFTSSNNPKVGQLFDYKVIATNNGDPISVGITDIVPAGLTFNSYTTTKGTYNSVSGLWNIAGFLKGESIVLHLFVTPTDSLAGTIVTNTATSIGQMVTATIVVPKNTVTNITLTQTVSNLTPKVGQNFYYTITATNNGPDIATGVQVLDKLPAGLTYKAYQATQGTYNSITGVWNVGTLANGATATLYILVTPKACAAGKSVTNTAKLTAENEYNTTKCPSASKTVTVKSQKNAQKYSHCSSYKRL